MSSATISVDEVVGQHQTVYDVYFSQADSTGSGVIGALDAANFLKQSKLKETVLKDIWELSDPTGKGYLDRQAFYFALKLIALAQSSQEVKIENLTLLTPAPKLGDLSSNITSLIQPDDPWYIKASQRLNFDKVFDSLSPIAGKLTGTRVKPFLVSTGLQVDVLGKIWELSDLDNDGALDRDEFLISMQLVTKAKEGVPVPDSLPPSLLPFKVRHTPIISNASPGSSVPIPYPSFEAKPWIVTFEEKSKSDLIFNQIDTDKDGFVTGSELKDVLIKTGLSQMILANIWALCDVNTTGKINSEQFALMMHFINKKLATGLDAPLELTPEMIPPSLRPKPALVEDSPYSKELEELQTQVTELQREKLYYDQRASEHDTLTRQKRTELSNLELELESLYKTLQEREMKKSQEQKKLDEFEDKLVKLDSQLNDMRLKFSTEREEIERLKTQIQHMELAMKNKDNDLNKIKADLQLALSEQAALEARHSSRREYLLEINNQLDNVTVELAKTKSKIELLKIVQTNLNKLMKEYDGLAGEKTLNEEIKQLEAENVRLKEQIKQAIDANTTELSQQNGVVAASGMFNQNSTFNESNFSEKFSPSFQFQSSSTTNNVNNAFDNFFSPASNGQQVTFGIDDPFQAFDPFKENNANDPFKENNTNDPFKSAPIGDKSADFSTDDPFSSPFDQIKNTTFNNHSSSNNQQANEDPFTKKAPPPRPAPPRPQTPNMKPTKTKTTQQTRPHTSLDFTRNSNQNNNLELFSNDFADPFNTPKQNKEINNTLDPFGTNHFEWNAFSNTNNKQMVQSKVETWDPFS